MDTERPQTGGSASLSVARAAVVLVLFVAAVVVLVDVGTRPSVSGVPSSAPTTLPTTSPHTGTTAAAGASSTTTTTAKATTTTAKSTHGHRGAGTTTTTIAPSSVSVVVANATSTNGLAAHYSTVIGAGGWKMGTPTDASTAEATSAVYYAAGFQEPAASIATAIGVAPTRVLPLTTAVPVNGVAGTDVVVVIGDDLASTATTTT